MKQKLFTLLTLALFFCSGAWATDVVRTLTATNAEGGMKVGDTYIKAVAIDGDISWSSNKMKMGSSKSGSFDVEIKDDHASSYTISQIVITYDGSGRPSAFSGNEIAVTSNTTWSAGSTTPTKVSFSITSSSSEVKIQQLDITLTPSGVSTHTVTLDEGEGTTGGSAKATEGSNKLSITTKPVYAGHAIVGYYKEAELENLIADASGNLQAGTDYTNASSEWTSTADDITLYTKWRAVETFCSLAPATSGDAPTAKNQKINMQDGGYGGAIYTAGAKNDAWSSAFAYTSNGLGLQTGGADSVRVELNDYLKEGSVISLTLVSGGESARGLKLFTTTKSEVASLGWTTTHTSDAEETFTYTVTSESAIKDKKQFLLQRNNTVYLKSLTVTECQPGGIITASGYNTYSSSKALDLSTLSAGTTAYVATAVSGGKIVLTKTTAKVPANTGLFLAGTANQKFTVDIATGGTSAPAVNLLVAAPDGTTVTDAESGYYNYVFGWSDAANPGFYLISGTDATLGAGKAYLHTSAALDAPEGRGGFIFEDEDVTGIAEVSTKKTFNGDFYNLNGQKISQPTKGLYIVNGKKVIIK